jgi:hypothetical protein
MINWLDVHFSDYKPTKGLVRRAVRHLKKSEKKQLFSKDISQMRGAEGRWYESLIYEMVIDIAGKSDLIAHIVRKGADAPFPPPDIVPGDNGLFYSNRGDIKICGNGQDIAEVDLLLVDSTGAVAFAEIVTSPADLKGLEQEVHYKKRLLGYIYGQVSVPFLLFSSVDISRSSIIQRLVKEPDSVLIVTRSCEDLKGLMRSSDTRGVPRKPVQHAKFISLDAIQPPRKFDYKQLHDMRRDRVLQLLMAGGGRKEVERPDEIPPIVKKILFGALYKDGIRTFCGDEGLMIRDHHHSCEDVMKKFSKVILAVDIPGFEPVIYLRVRNKKEYLKMVPRKIGGYRVESKRSPRMKGFFWWLESIEPTLGARVMERYTKEFLFGSEPVSGKKKKKRKKKRS